MVVWKTAGNAMQAGGSLLCIQASRWVVWHVRGAATAAASLAAAAAAAAATTVAQPAAALAAAAALATTLAALAAVVPKETALSERECWSELQSSERQPGQLRQVPV